jgi:signal peptidase II
MMLWQASGLRQRTALALVFGGAVGNLYDRLVRGSVTDFIDWYVGQYHWATFNLADAAITTGACLVALELFRKPAAATSCSRG